MGPSEKEICIKCDEGGELLACADSCCPVAVHERCMGCPVIFDELGKFYCPYCRYRLAAAKLRQAREHVLSKKQALHTFIDKEMIGNREEVPSPVTKSICERADESEKHSDVPQNFCNQQRVVGQQLQSGPVVACTLPSDHTSCEATTTDFRLSETGNRVQVNDPQPSDHISCEAAVAEVRVSDTGHRVQVNDLQEVGEHQLEESVEDHNRDAHLSNSRVAEEENLGNKHVLAELGRNSDEIAGEQMRREATATFMNVDPTMQQHSKGRRRVETGDSTRGESKLVSARRKAGQQVNKVKDEPISNDSRRRLTRTSASLLESNNEEGQLVQVKQPSMQLPVVLPNGKRRRVLWKREEEEMLEEGVQKFSTTINKNIPWRKILEFGSHVFDQTRTPSDLKDKWKNICSKYGGQV